MIKQTTSAEPVSLAALAKGMVNPPDIRRALIEADLVECMLNLPGQLFYNTQKFSLN